MSISFLYVTYFIPPVQNKPCDEPPIVVVPSLSDVAQSRKKCVFRVIIPDGSEYLLQAESHESMRHWVNAIKQLNQISVGRCARMG